MQNISERKRSTGKRARDKRLLERFTKAALETRKEVLAVLVYGSFARGEEGPKSDIDLFVLVDAPNARMLQHIESELNSLAFDIANSLLQEGGGGAASGRLARVEVMASTPKRAASEPVWQNVLSEGRVIAARGPVIVPSLKNPANEFELYTIDTASMSESERAKVSLYMHGRTSSYLKGGKRVRKKYAGVLKMVGGTVFGRGVFSIPAKNSMTFQDFLTSHKVPFTSRRVILLEGSMAG